MRAYRIGIGGIAIESSTFSPLHSTLEDFTQLHGDALLSRYPFMPSWNFQNRDDITWLPCLHARAIPGGAVEAAAYAQLKHTLLENIQAALPLDGSAWEPDRAIGRASRHLHRLPALAPRRCAANPRESLRQFALLPRQRYP